MGFIYSQLFVTPRYPTASCAGQTIIVIGANVGLGKEAARHFARLGATKVILACRNLKAGELAKTEIQRTTRCSPSALEIWPLDLLNYDSIRAFSHRVNALPRLDTLLCNAGVAGYTWVSTSLGHERMIQVNCISTFYLALLILPKLKSTAKQFNIQPHLTIVTSNVHAWAKFPERSSPNIFTALDDESKANLDERYPVSKLLQVLLVREWAPLLRGSDVILNMLSPGLCHSELSRDGGAMLTILKFFLGRSTEKGSRTLVASAQAGPNSHGTYMHDCEIHDHDEVSEFVRSAEGKKTGTKVWKELKEILEEIQPGVTSNI